MENLVNLKINGKEVSVPQGTTILDAARKAGIRIPTLCYLRDINAIGACRVCVCEVKGARSLVASCVYPVSEGMEVFTNTPKVLASRKTTVELILSDHHQDCLSCVRSENCELQRLSKELGCDGNKYRGVKNSFELDESTPYIVRDNNKCILCRRCVAACKNGSAMLFVSSKVSQLALLPQGRVEAARRVKNMVAKMDELGFGNCTNTRACEAVCPKNETISNIARLNREMIKAKLAD